MRKVCNHTMPPHTHTNKHTHTHTHTHACVRAISKTLMWYVAPLKHCVVCFLNVVFLLFPSLNQLCLYSTFYLFFFFHIVTFDFIRSRYLLNTLKHRQTHSAYKILLVFLLFLHVTRNIAYVTT